MTEVVMLPEMLEAGVEAYVEARQRGLDEENTCVAVYLAMRCIEEMFETKAGSRVTH